jgi:hypothetical protein
MVFKKIAKKLLSKSPSLLASAQNYRFDQEHKQDFTKFKGKEKDLLLEIHKNGFALIPDFFDADLCNACIDDMDSMFETHPEFVHKKEDLRIFGAEELSDNIKIFSNYSLLDNLANGYNGVPTVCGFTLAGKINSAPQEYGSGGPWHRDSFFRQFKSMIYLSDVGEQNGPFQLISNSHIPKIKVEDKKKFKLDEMQALFNQDLVTKILEDDPNRLKTITGKAGTALIVDTSIIHRGMPLKNGNRYALTNYYFEKTQINQHLVDHFSPLASPKKVLSLAN